MDSALLGVLIGGGLAIAGQILTEYLRARARTKRQAKRVRAAARVQRIELWQGQTAILETLRSGEWWPPSMDPVLRSDVSDRRLLAQHLDGVRWQKASTAWRKFQERSRERDLCVNAGETGPSPLAVEKLLVTFFSLDEARSALAQLSEMEQEFRELPATIDRELVRRLVDAEPSISTAGRAAWLDPDGPAAPQAWP
jgi:hypothetical protein